MLSSRALAHEKLVRQLKKTARRHNIPVVEYAPKTARRIVCGYGNAKKIDIARMLCWPYPELEIHLEQPCAWQERYWSNMFDAVAIGLAHLIVEKKAQRLRGPRS